MLLSVFVVFFGLLIVTRGAPPAEHNTRTFRNALNQQSLQTILQSIEERLRNLDQVYSIRYTPRTEFNSDQFIRKIELLETKLARMESQIEAQLEKISENMSSKNFKDDIAKDQIFRKIDSVYERFNHKLDYVEGKLDMGIFKLQTKIETGISKIERLDHSFSVRQADMESEISEGVEMMKNVKNNIVSIENRLMNVTKYSIETSFDKQADLFNNVTNLITQIDKNVNNSLDGCNQKDFLNDFANKNAPLTKTFKGYEDQIQSYGNKVNNMYNELWKKSASIETTIKNSVLLMNLTRKELQDTMNNLLKDPGHRVTTSTQNDGQLEIIVDTFTNTFQRKFSELSRKLESNFENIMLVQNLFLESCHRIQMDETQLENKISVVLEKLLDAITNRSSNTFKEIQSMEELIKTHDSNVYRTLNQNTNTILKLSEKTSEDRKKLEKVLSTIKKDIANALETIQNQITSEDEENNQKFDTIASILLELQKQVNNLDNHVNEENINHNGQQILQDILLRTKDLSEKDTFTQEFNRNISQNVQVLSKLMENINHLFTANNMRVKTFCDNAKYKVDINNNSVKNSELSEDDQGPIDIVLKILPENHISNSTKKSAWSIFNYTVIKDETENYNYDKLNKEELLNKSGINTPVLKRDNIPITNNNTVNEEQINDLPSANANIYKINNSILFSESKNSSNVTDILMIKKNTDKINASSTYDSVSKETTATSAGNNDNNSKSEFASLIENNDATINAEIHDESTENITDLPSISKDNKNVTIQNETDVSTFTTSATDIFLSDKRSHTTETFDMNEKLENSTSQTYFQDSFEYTDYEY